MRRSRALVRRTIAFVGDGGFLMSGQELVTAAQHRLPVKIILCDNNAWGSILVSQQRRYGADGIYGTRLSSPDFALVARGYGVPAFTVEKTSDFPAAFAEALAAQGSRLGPRQTRRSAMSHPSPMSLPYEWRPRRAGRCSFAAHPGTCVCSGAGSVFGLKRSPDTRTPTEAGANPKRVAYTIGW